MQDVVEELLAKGADPLKTTSVPWQVLMALKTYEQDQASP
jgi:hypothetical protein